MKAGYMGKLVAIRPENDCTIEFMDNNHGIIATIKN